MGDRAVQIDRRAVVLFVLLVLSLAAGLPAASWRVLVDLLMWVGTALAAVLFVAPGQVATAELDLRSGACRSGRTLGYLVAGSCRMNAPAPTPTPTPPPSATPTPSPAPPPPPFHAPAGIGAFRVDTSLAVTR